MRAVGNIVSGKFISVHRRGGYYPPAFLCVYPLSHSVTAPLDKNKGSQISLAVAGLHRLPYLFHKPVDGVGQFGEHFRIAVLHGVNDTVLQVVLEDHLAGAV